MKYLRYCNTIPKFIKWFGRKYVHSKLMRKKCKKIEMRSNLRKYPDDWFVKYVDGEGQDFEFGMDITECGICKLYKEQGAEDLTPYLCLGDYAQFKAFFYIDNIIFS